MKFIDTLLFSFAILFLLIGIHQSMMVGFAASYWLFMLSFGGLMWYQIRKKNRKAESTDKTGSNKGDTPAKKRKYKI